MTLAIVLTGGLMNADAASAALEALRQVAITVGCDPKRTRGTMRYDSAGRTWEVSVSCQGDPEPGTWEPAPPK